MMMFFTAAAATIGVVSVRALPVPDLDAQAMISTSELPSAIDVHNQASPQDRELYKLVRKSQVPELGIDEKMDLIIASEFYKQHERLRPALAEIYHQVVKSFEPRHRVPNEMNKHLLLFKLQCLFHFGYPRAEVEARKEFLTQRSGIYIRFRLFHQEIIARMNAGEMESGDMVIHQLADVNLNRYLKLNQTAFSSVDQEFF
ncbi:hypothetical protein C8R42DRAFT_726227 [Lentinula raphanica]|nr:hypothetical protein C8R42DRAFT_726227 [Lentinula raphanica]